MLRRIAVAALVLFAVPGALAGQSPALTIRADRVLDGRGGCSAT
jgi:hypothetical protein